MLRENKNNQEFLFNVERFNEALLSSKMSIKTLATLTGVTTSTIYRYRSGRIKPSMQALEYLADALAVNVHWLRGFDAPRRKTVELVRTSDGSHLLKQTVYESENYSLNSTDLKVLATCAVLSPLRKRELLKLAGDLVKLDKFELGR